MLRLYGRGVIALIAALLSATPVLSQTAANFGTLTLAPGFGADSGRAAGNTGGSFSLSSLANRDRNGNRCIGFGDPNPDHILVLQKDFPKLNVLVNGGGQDTTLVIRGPNDQTIRCGDDTGSKKDASVKDSNWAAGTYRIWVGSIDSGQRVDYSLSVRE
ncbi:MAG TPA: hypothetical protein V6C90_00425 [Coleofasciculaceae cyanobacterium]|jgi:hypothetical protein